MKMVIKVDSKRINFWLPELIMELRSKLWTKFVDVSTNLKPDVFESCKDYKNFNFCKGVLRDSK